MRSECNAFRGPTGVSFLWKIIWMANILEKRKVAFFVWTAALGRIQMVDNLRKHHILIFDWCCVCSGESIDHLLFH